MSPGFFSEDANPSPRLQQRPHWAFGPTSGRASLRCSPAHSRARASQRVCAADFGQKVSPPSKLKRPSGQVLATGVACTLFRRANSPVISVQDVEPTGKRGESFPTPRRSFRLRSGLQCPAFAPCRHRTGACSSWRQRLAACRRLGPPPRCDAKPPRELFENIKVNRAYRIDTFW